MADTEEKIEVNLTICLKCKQEYDDEKKVPRFLQCHHTFCSECISVKKLIVRIF